MARTVSIYGPMHPPLDIQLIVEQHQHRSGTPITGQVIVTVDEPLSCKQLAIALQNTSRLLDDRGEVVLEQDFQQTLVVDPLRHNSWISGVDPCALYNGPWVTGRQYEYPFELMAPENACYLGRHFQYHWLLQAHVVFEPDCGEQMHATALHLLEITRGSPASIKRETTAASSTQHLIEDAMDPPLGWPEKLVSHGSSMIFLVLFGVIPLVSGAAAVVLAISDTLGLFTLPLFAGNADPISLAFTGICAFGFGCYMLPLMLDSMRGDDMQLYITPHPLVPGDELQFVAMIHRSLADSFSDITAHITCRENTAGPGTEETSEVLFQKQLSIPVSVAVEAGRWLMVPGRLHLPPDLPASITADFGDVEYTFLCECQAHDEPAPLVSIEETLLVV